MIIANKDNLNKLIKVLNELADAKLKVGFFDGKKHDKSDLTTAEIAKTNEYGTNKIPARPFMRQTLLKHNNFSNDLKSIVSDSIIFKTSPTSAFKKTGVKIMQEMQREFTTGEFEPNSLVTIIKKGSSRPLINTGFLRNSISWRVEK